MSLPERKSDVSAFPVKLLFLPAAVVSLGMGWNQKRNDHSKDKERTDKGKYIRLRIPQLLELSKRSLAGIGCADTGMGGGLLQCHEIAIEDDVTLEFKLFALRHPDSKERLRKAFEMSKATNNDDAIYESVFGLLTKDRKFDSNLALLALGPNCLESDTRKPL